MLSAGLEPRLRTFWPCLVGFAASGDYEGALRAEARATDLKLQLAEEASTECQGAAGGSIRPCCPTSRTHETSGAWTHETSGANPRETGPRSPLALQIDPADIYLLLAFLFFLFPFLQEFALILEACAVGQAGEETLGVLHRMKEEVSLSHEGVLRGRSCGAHRARTSLLCWPCLCNPRAARRWSR